MGALHPVLIPIGPGARLAGPAGRLPLIGTSRRYRSCSEHHSLESVAPAWPVGCDDDLFSQGAGHRWQDVCVAQSCIGAPEGAGGEVGELLKSVLCWRPSQAEPPAPARYPVGLRSALHSPRSQCRPTLTQAVALLQAPFLLEVASGCPFPAPFICVRSHTSRRTRTPLCLCVVSGKACSELGQTLFVPPFHPHHLATPHLVDDPLLSPALCFLSPPNDDPRS